MQTSDFGRYALGVYVGTILLAGCSGTNSTSPQPNMGTPPLSTVRTIPDVITRGSNCILPSETKRRINRWASFMFGHCANGGFVPLQANWSSSGGHLRVFNHREDAIFKASSPGTYTITASCCGGSWQSTANVKQ
jgi:hypothetical protein